MSRPVTVIEAERGWSFRDLAEVWRYRELLAFLSWRDIRVRYRQTFVGGTWALIEPFISALVLTLVFHGVAKFESGDYPYVLFCYAAMLIWNFFSRALRDSSQSLVSNALLLRRVYFPRVVLPLSSIITSCVDFACAMLMYALLMLYYDMSFSPTLITAPLWLLLATVNVLGVGLLLASINVRWRDVSQALPFLVQTWMFLTPVAFSFKDRPGVWQAVARLNPMTGVVEGMRWALLPDYAMDWSLLASTLVVGAIGLAAGLYSFGRTERSFADIV